MSRPILPRPEGHYTQSGMPKGKPFPENELVELFCDVDDCEYHVRVHQSTQEANMRQHKEKCCPLKTNPEDVESAPKGNPLGHQRVDPIHSWYALSKALSEERTPGLLKGHLDDLDAISAPRTFDTGATRDGDDGKMDYEGFLSPLVLERYAEYMHWHRYQSDGQLRDSDNWQKGIPTDEYMKSMFRHFMDLWLIHRGHEAGRDDIQDVLCAVMFNAMGYLFEILRGD